MDLSVGNFLRAVSLLYAREIHFSALPRNPTCKGIMYLAQGNRMKLCPCAIRYVPQATYRYREEHVLHRQESCFRFRRRSSVAGTGCGGESTSAVNCYSVLSNPVSSVIGHPSTFRDTLPHRHRMWPRTQR